MEEKQQDHLSDMGLQIDGEVRQQFSVAGKWAKFISILIFICSGILLIAGFAGGGDIIREFKNISPAYQSFSELEGGILIGIIVFIVGILWVEQEMDSEEDAEIKVNKSCLLSQESRILNDSLFTDRNHVKK